MRIGKRPHYHPVLRIPEGRSGNVEVAHVLKEPDTDLPLANARTLLFGQRGGVLKFQHATIWHELTEGRNVLMTDLPIEQRQLDDLAQGMKGTVLVGGLGLGYAVTALAAKRLVTKIIVVERSSDVINLVWPHLSADVCRKATVVCDDLFSYLRKCDHLFRFGLYDIWQSDSETTFHNVVAPLRKLSKRNVLEVRCWNEDIMRGQLFHSLFGRDHIVGVTAVSSDH